jgi:DNA polymerase III delta prime subunit
LIDALRSRTQHIRLVGVPRKRIESRLAELCSAEGIEPVRGILGDIAHISEGNLRKAIFTTEVLALRELLGQRENLHRLLTYDFNQRSATDDRRPHYEVKSWNGDGRKTVTRTLESSKER